VTGDTRPVGPETGVSASWDDPVTYLKFFFGPPSVEIPL